MELSNYPAMAYDTWFYAVTYYNPEYSAKEGFSAMQMINGREFNGISEVQKLIPRLPQLVAPFFFIRGNKSITSKFMFPQIKYGFYDLEYYKKRIKDNAQELYAHMITEYFNAEQQAGYHTTEDYIEKITELDVPLDIKLQLSLVLCNFDRAVSVLIDTLEKIHLAVEAVYAQNSDITEYTFRRMQEEENIKRYREYTDASDELIQNAVASVSLINKNLAMNLVSSDDRLVLVYGTDHLSMFPDINGYKYILGRFFDGCSSTLRFKLLDIIAEKGEITLKELSELMQMNPSSVLHNLRALLEAEIIEIARTEQKNIYYRVNKIRMRAVQSGMGEFFEKILNESSICNI